MSTEIKKYFALGNVNHNGTEFKLGDEIALDDASAQTLLREGVVSLEKPVVAAPAPVEETPVVEKKKDEPTIGGAPVDSGEPSLDGRRDSGAPSSETKKSFLERMGFVKKEGEEVQTEKHVISEQDLIDEPGLAEHGVKAGDEIELGPEISKEEAEKLLAENGTGAPATDPSANL